MYVPTRRTAEELAGRLRDEGYAAAHYHGGMAAGARTRRHEEFLAGRVPVMVATSAFGMGIDKPDIRWVAHMALPDSPDSYLQEIGRAGRDGAAGAGGAAVPGRGRGPAAVLHRRRAGRVGDP